MSVFFRALILVCILAVLGLSVLFILFFAFATGNIPNGTRLIYRGFYFDSRNSIAYRLCIDTPGDADIYIFVDGVPVLTKDLTPKNFATLGFHRSHGSTLRNGTAGLYAIADYPPEGGLSLLQFYDDADLTLPFASRSGRLLKLPLTRQQIEEEFGVPAKVEWTYSKPEWR